jgi:hypothetical protein
MTECIQRNFGFQDLGSRRVEANFEGGFLSSDGGSLYLREIDQRHHFMEKLAGCFWDHRKAELIEHSVEELLRQRIFGLALGYEDLNDHDSLRHDPLLAVACGKSDPLGLTRRESPDRGKALAGKSTLNRLELAVQGPDPRYKKIVADVNAIEDLLLEWGVAALPRRSGMIVLDFDATDDRLHGEQEGRFYHGYYGHYCYLPLYCFCGNIPLWAQLRTSDKDASTGTVEALEKIVAAIRRRFGRNKKILVRGDSGYARDEIMSWCEGKKHLFYCLGLKRNTRLEAELTSAFAVIDELVTEKCLKAPCRIFKDFTYRTRKSWSRSRRVVGKAELTEAGRNPRYVVTNLSAEQFVAEELYEEIYCARGAMENQIKVQQMDLFADRTSTRIFDANQLRLWFSAIAHLLVETLRHEVLGQTSLGCATIGKIRLRFFKLAARVKVSCRRILVEWCTACPNRADHLLAHAALSG